MKDYIVNLTLDELKEVLNESCFPLRFIDKIKIQEAFNKFCVEYDMSMLPYINYNNFELASQINKKVTPTFIETRKSITTDHFFKLVLYFDLDFSLFKDDFIVVFKDSIFTDSQLSKYQGCIYDQIFHISDEALSDAKQLNEIKYSGLNIGPANRKTFLVTLSKFESQGDVEFKEVILSDRLCLSLKVDKLKSYICACYYKNEIINIDKINV